MHSLLIRLRGFLRNWVLPVNFHIIYFVLIVLAIMLLQPLSPYHQANKETDDITEMITIMFSKVNAIFIP